MQILTKEFLERIDKMNTVDQIKEEIIKEHGILKKELTEKGFEILVGMEVLQSGQTFYGEDVALAHYYKELYSMVQGITSGWVHYMNNTEIYDNIKIQLDSILESKSKSGSDNPK